MDCIRLIIVAVGGQGNLLASKVLGEAALSAGVPVRMSEVHGMAQRGGVVESALVFGDARSMLISDNEADVLLGFEPLETLRALAKCNRNTVVITNTAPVPPISVSLGKSTYPDLGRIQEIIRAKTKRLVAFDGLTLAKTAGDARALNMVLIGALIQTGIVPIAAEQVRQIVSAKTKAAFVETNLRAFDFGFEAAKQAG
jgi:indolepyruvate ferredoxin oxidoreductase, beta subunit